LGYSELDQHAGASMNKPTIYPLFSAPVYVNNVGDFESPDIKSLEYSRGTYPFSSSTDKNVLDRADFAATRGVVTREIELYAREVLRVSKNVEFYITNSWVNIYRPGESAGPHIHHNSLISGVLYLKVSEASGALVFHRDIYSIIPFPPALDLDMDSFNLYNCKSWGHKPKVNDICLFPSMVMHSADPNESSEERWCLAFNVFARGNIGVDHKLTIR
jgi:uncharacterized protein (TIGR02466 family)